MAQISAIARQRYQALYSAAGWRLTEQRLADCARIVKDRSVGTPEANARATALLGQSVRDQANVLAYIDSFMVLGLP